MEARAPREAPPYSFMAFFLFFVSFVVKLGFARLKELVARP